MNGPRFAHLVAATCLAEDRPLGEALQALVPASRAGSLASAGRLEDALATLGLARPIARLAKAWPKALRPALRHLDDIPSGGELRLPFLQTCVYLGLLLVMQGSVLLLLNLKVLPIFERLSKDLQMESPAFLDGAVGLLVLGVPALFAWGVVGAVGPDWLPGWGRHLARARDAALGAALVGAGAPADVLGEWRRTTRSLGGPEPLPTRDDLAALSRASGAEAELSMRRMVALFRMVGLAFVSVVAVVVTVSIYLSAAKLALVR